MFFTLSWWFTFIAVSCLVQCDKQHPWKNCSAGQVFLFLLLGRRLPFLPSDNQFLKDYFPFLIHSFFAILESEIWDTHCRCVVCVCVFMFELYVHMPAVQQTQVQSLAREDPLEKGMATHSSIPAGKIPWTEEPGRPQSMGSQRVRHNWAALTFVCTYTHMIRLYDMHVCNMYTIYVYIIYIHMYVYM